MSLDVGLVGCLTKKEKENYYAVYYRVVNLNAASKLSSVDWQCIWNS